MATHKIFKPSPPKGAAQCPPNPWNTINSWEVFFNSICGLRFCEDFDQNQCARNPNPNTHSSAIIPQVSWKWNNTFPTLASQADPLKTTLPLNGKTLERLLKSLYFCITMKNGASETPRIAWHKLDEFGSCKGSRSEWPKWCNNTEVANEEVMLLHC